MFIETTGSNMEVEYLLLLLRILSHPHNKKLFQQMKFYGFSYILEIISVIIGTFYCPLHSPAAVWEDLSHSIADVKVKYPNSKIFLAIFYQIVSLALD